jgi:hypothetical protein
MKALTIGGLLWLLLCAGGSRVEAQEVASSFEQLVVLVKPGDKIAVVDVAGREMTGRIEKLSREALVLDTSAGPRHLAEVDVATIRQRRGDSLMNGAIIGAVAGTAYFATIAAILTDTEGGDVIIPTLIAGVAVCGAMGAAAGVGIDALITRRQVIFERSASQRRVAVLPVLGRGRGGVAVAVTF